MLSFYVIILGEKYLVLKGEQMSRYYLIGDVHGKASMLEELLKTWDSQTPLIFLGDLIDRGEDSLSVLRYVYHLVKEKGAVCLSGNHEYMFLAWLDDPEGHYDHYRRNGGDTTINSLLSRPIDAPVDGIEDAKCVQEIVPELIQFIREMPFYVETEKYIFVHAGVDLSLEDWHDTTDYQKVWIRQPFHEGKNQTGKTIVFGHTPTLSLFHDKSARHKLWIKDNKIGMDGGAVYGGFLHGIVLDDNGIEEHYYIENTGFVSD